MAVPLAAMQHPAGLTLDTCFAMQQAAAPWNTTNGKFNRFSQTAMVTPAISGIRNKDALQVCHLHSCWPLADPIAYTLPQLHEAA
jgi:hypothetical protein